jgi:hypothetical protein
MSHVTVNVYSCKYKIFKVISRKLFGGGATATLQELKVNRKKAFSLLIITALLLSSLVVLISIPTVQAETYLSSGWENSDGSDETDNSIWETQYEGVSVSNTYSYTGLYGLQVTNTNWYSYVQKSNLTLVNPFYVSEYVYFTDLPISGEKAAVIVSGSGDTGGYDLGSYISVFATYSTDAVYWQLAIAYGASNTSTSAVLANTWYHVVAEIGTTSTTLYVNEVAVATLGSLGFTPSSVRVGGYFTGTAAFIADVVQIDSEYVDATEQEFPAPTFSNAWINATRAGNQTMFSTNFIASDGIDGFIFSYNNNATTVNQTYTVKTGTTGSINYTVTLPLSIGLDVQGKFYVNSSHNVWGASDWINATTTKADYPSALHSVVDGTDFYVRDINNSIVILRGINKNGFTDTTDGWWSNGAWTGYGVWNETAVNATLNDMRYNSGFNYLRLQFMIELWWYNMNYTSGGTGYSNMLYQDAITRTIELCADRGIYVELVPYGVNIGEGQVFLPYPPHITATDVIANSGEFVEFWRNMSYQLRVYPNVMYQLFNEPATDESGWMAVSQLAYNAIREGYSNSGSDQIVMIQWGYSSGCDFALNYPVEGYNIIYSNHIYRTLSDVSTMNTFSEGEYTLEAMNATLWTTQQYGDMIQNKLPILITETGCWYSTNPLSDEMEYWSNLNFLMNEYEIGICVWEWFWDQSEGNESGRVEGIFDGGWLPDTNVTLNYAGLELVEGITNATVGVVYYHPEYYLAYATVYVTEISWVSPLAQQYNSSTVGFEVSTTGSNDTNIALQIQLYNSSVAVYGSNFTSASGTFTSLTNGTYTAAVYAEGDNGASDYEEVIFTVYLTDSYILSLSITSPANTTYTSGIVAYSVSYSGNETGVTYQINAYLNSVAVGSNLTSASGNFIGLSNGTYVFAAYSVGTHGTEDYKTVTFTILLTTDEDAPDLTIISPFNRTYITSTFNVEITHTGTAALIWYNVKNGSTWIYESNTTYTAATSLTGYADGTYTFYAFAINNEGETDEATTVFTVGIIANPLLPQVNVDTYWLFLQEGDFLGAVQALLVSTFLSFEAAIAMIIMLFMIPIYLRTKSLLLLSILWILIGSFLVAAVPMASGIGILFIALAIGGLLWRLFRPSGYG